MGLGRSERHHARVRHLYVLRFNNNAVYIGQTVDLKRRENQHRSAAGGWKTELEFIPLESVTGTKEELEHHEFAWRYVAQCNGHVVYGKPPNIIVNPAKKLTWERRRLVKQKAWTIRKKHNHTWSWATASAVVALGLALWMLL